jgi:hypothetical protein
MRHVVCGMRHAFGHAACGMRHAIRVLVRVVGRGALRMLGCGGVLRMLGVVLMSLRTLRTLRWVLRTLRTLRTFLRAVGTFSKFEAPKNQNQKIQRKP